MKFRSTLRDWFSLSYTLRGNYAKSLLLWNPIFTLIMCATLYTDGNFLREWLLSLFIADQISTLCHLAVFLISAIERWRVRPVWWYLAVSCCAMPFAMYLSFAFTGVVCARIGVRWTAPQLSEYRPGLLLGAGMAGFFFLARTRRDAREAATKAENERLQAQISALTAQMKPHLFFNALNTVASLISTDPDAAEDTVLRLSELYRGLLNSSRQSTHSLATELEICNAYLAVEKARFGSRLEITVNVPNDLDLERLQVPVLTVQPLIENAIKHGLSSRSHGNIFVSVQNESDSIQIAVEDDGVGLGNSEKKGAGTAIENCRNRMNLTYGAKGTLEIFPRNPLGTTALLRFPTEVLT